MAGEVDYVATFIIHHPAGDIALGCQSLEGGNPEPETGKSRNPVTGRTKVRGGLRERSDLKIAVEIELDIWNRKAQINESVGRDRYTAVKQFVDSRRSPAGPPETFAGIVGKPDWGAFDVSGGDNTSMLEIESGVDDL